MNDTHDDLGWGARALGALLLAVLLVLGATALRAPGTSQTGTTDQGTGSESAAGAGPGVVDGAADASRPESSSPDSTPPDQLPDLDPEADDDGDGFSNAEEGTVDSDGDGQADYLDQDSDNDGLFDEFEGRGDPDGDGVDNRLDTDSNGNDLSDGREGAGDSDSDGVPDHEDETPGHDASVEGPLDGDNDGVPDDADNCPSLQNTDQEDADGDGVGDACEDDDRDGDGYSDDVDNCPDEPNRSQADSDDDGTGDACEDGIDVPREACGSTVPRNGLVLSQIESAAAAIAGFELFCAGFGDVLGGGGPECARALVARYGGAELGEGPLVDLAGEYGLVGVFGQGEMPPIPDGGEEESCGTWIRRPEPVLVPDLDVDDLLIDLVASAPAVVAPNITAAGVEALDPTVLGSLGDRIWELRASSLAVLPPDLADVVGSAAVADVPIAVIPAVNAALLAQVSPATWAARGQVVVEELPPDVFTWFDLADFDSADDHQLYGLATQAQIEQLDPAVIASILDANPIWTVPVDAISGVAG